MSKDNMLLGYARGKVGSLVFARRKGVQITRAYNANPANPRTPAQINQRMKMYAPTFLYKKVRSRFFPFAFEDQKPNETPYNAFMRHNISVSPWVSKTLASDYAPVPFRAIMSEGSISAPEYSLGLRKAQTTGDNQTATVYTIAVLFGSVQDVDTVASFTRVMTSKGFQEGDLFTFVSFKSAGLSVENGNVLYDGSSNLQFKYAQVKLNSSDNTNLFNLGISAVWTRDELQGAPDAVGMIVDDTEQDETSYGGCIIVTRASGSKVLSSSSVLDLNDYAANTILSTMSGVNYRDTFASPSYRVEEADYLNPNKVTE